MPELPEVETIKIQLEKALIGKTIKAVLVRLDKMVKVGPGKISNIKIGSKAESEKFVKAIVGRKVVAVKRRAKFLIIELSQGFQLMVHLRMSGQLIHKSKGQLKESLVLSLTKELKKETLPNKHTHIEFDFNDGSKLFFNDHRQFGHMRIVTAEESKVLLDMAVLGPEPLDMTGKEFREIIKKNPSKRAKDFLLNQQMIAGIGNIYADESLFISKIQPLRKVGTLTDDEISRLFKAIQAVLKRSIKLGGSSIKTYLNVNGLSGSFVSKHLVYGRAGKDCVECGNVLEKTIVGSRTTVYCKVCQK